MTDKERESDLSFVPPTTSVLYFKRGAIAFGVFNFILLLTLMYETNLFDNGVEGYSIVLLASVLIIQAFLSWLLSRHSSGYSKVGHPIIIATSYILIIFYGILIPQINYNYVCNQCNIGPFVASVTVQSIILGLVFAVYQRPLVPVSVIRTGNFEVHSTNWWRMTQALMTLTIAVGIGLFAQFLIDSDSIYVGKLIPFILGVGIGLLLILLFIFKKMFTLERMM